MIIKINNEEYLSIEDVESIVGQAESTINVKVRYGAFPKPVKLPVVKFWKRSDIELYLESMRE